MKKKKRNNRNLKILQLIVMDKLRTGGGIQVYRLAKELVKLGHDVTSMFSENPEFKEDFKIFKDTGVKLEFMDMSRVKLDLRSFRSVRNFRRYIIEADFDIIHVHKGRAATFAWFATIGLDVNIVSNRGVINPLTFFRSLKYRWSRIKKIIAVSQAVKDVMIQSGGIDPDKIKVVYGSVDIEEFKPGIESNLRKEFKISRNEKIIGFVGNAGKRKGLEYLIKAFEILLEKDPNLTLVLVGVDKDSIKKFELPPQITTKIIATGFRTDIVQIISGFDVFAFSGVGEEGLTGSVREAAAIGLPIVTTNVAGNAELIKDKENGLVVPMRDPKQLAEAIDFLLKNKKQAFQFGKNARDFIYHHMTDYVRAKAIEEIYFQILKENQQVQ